MDEWVALVKASGRERHSDVVAWLKAEHGFGHGNAFASAERVATPDPSKH